MSENLPRYLDTVQAAWVGLSPKTLQRMRVTGDGPPYVKWGRRVIYDRTDLDDWMAWLKRRFTGESVDDRKPDAETKSSRATESAEEAESTRRRGRAKGRTGPANSATTPGSPDTSSASAAAATACPSPTHREGA